MEQSTFQTYYWQNDKVRLRLWEPKDAPYDYTNNLDSEAMALDMEEICLPPRKTKVDTDGDSAEPNASAPAFTIEDLNGNYVGRIQYNYINERRGTFSIGLFLNREQRGKGYGKAAMSILLRYAFDERRLHKFNGYCLGVNTASAAMMKSLGCKLEGIVREVIYLHGKYHDSHLYGLTEQEYRTRYNGHAVMVKE